MSGMVGEGPPRPVPCGSPAAFLPTSAGSTGEDSRDGPELAGAAIGSDARGIKSGLTEVAFDRKV